MIVKYFKTLLTDFLPYFSNSLKKKYLTHHLIYFSQQVNIANMHFFCKQHFYSTNYFISLDWLLELFVEFFLMTFILYNLISIFRDIKKPVFLYYRWLFIYFVVLVTLSIKLFIFSWPPSKIIFGFTVLNCLYILFSKWLIIVLTALILWLSKNKFKNNAQLNCVLEIPLLIGFSVVFMLFLTASYDLFGAYLALEGLGLTLYVLGAISHQGVISIEAAIKYFSLGALSTGILLLGISIIFGLVGSLDFLELQIFLGGSAILLSFLEAKIGVLFIIFGLMFKISIFPCHIWIADVYEGVWNPITAFFAIPVKVCLILFLIRFLFNVVFNLLFYFQVILSFSAIGSMLVGALMAIKQTKIKRFIAYTSINQVGFIVLGLAPCTLNGLISALIYTVLYATMGLIFFTIFLNCEHVVTRKSMVYLSDLYNFSVFHNSHSKYLALALFSMGGLPPFGGFFGKLFIYIAIIEAKLDTLLFISLLISAVSTFYYLNFIRYIYFEKHLNSKLFYYIRKKNFNCLLFLLSSILSVFIFIFPKIFPIISSVALSCAWPMLWF